jgi:ribonuclease VapC
MIVDTSALVAILEDEPEAAAFARIIATTEVCRVSVATRLEFEIVLKKRQGYDTGWQAERFLRSLRIMEEPVTLEQAIYARQAFYDFGKGRHPAGLNFGDCFVYALAKAMKEPLLYKGSDFAQTDVVPAYR